VASFSFPTDATRLNRSLASSRVASRPSPRASNGKCHIQRRARSFPSAAHSAPVTSPCPLHHAFLPSPPCPPVWPLPVARDATRPGRALMRPGKRSRFSPLRTIHSLAQAVWRTRFAWPGAHLWEGEQWQVSPRFSRVSLILLHHLPGREPDRPVPRPARFCPSSAFTAQRSPRGFSLDRANSRRGMPPCFLWQSS